MRTVLPVLLLAACEPGPNAETLLAELRLVAAVAEPPEVGVGEPYTLTAWVADPAGEGADVAVWSCLGEDECAEVRGPLEGDVMVADAVGIAPVPVWIAACAPDACDLDTRSEGDLLDPTGWLDDQPLVGATAGLRMSRITDAPPEERRTNPELVEAPEVDRVPAGGLEVLSFVAPGAASAYGLTTAGGFGMPSRQVASDGSVQLEYYAPDEPVDAVLYVVLSDDEGATTVWRAEVVVE